jgi:hypothetical protein
MYGKSANFATTSLNGSSILIAASELSRAM